MMLHPTALEAKLLPQLITWEKRGQLSRYLVYKKKHHMGKMDWELQISKFKILYIYIYV